MNGTKSTSGTISGVLVDAGTELYAAVTAAGAKTGKNSAYQVDVAGTGFVKANTADDDWTVLPDEYKQTIAAGTASPSVALFADEWVGYGDAIDYRKLTVNQTGSYDFTISGVENAVTLTLYTVNAKGALTKGKSVSVNGTKSTAGTISGVLVDAGTELYVAVTAAGAKTGKNSAYQVDVTGTGFVKANNADDDWTALTSEYTISGTTSFNDWVGYGDTIDYRDIDIASEGGIYSFNLSGVTDNVKLTVYSVNSGKLRAVKSVSATAAKSSVSTGDLCLAAGTKYVLAVESTNAKTGKNSDYTMEMEEKGIFTNIANNSWSTAEVPSVNPFDFSGVLTKSVGGDAVDCIDLTAGSYSSLSLDAASGKVKISFFDANQKAVKASSVKFADGSVKSNLSTVTLAADNAVTDNLMLGSLDDAIKYLKIEAMTTGMDSYLLKLA